MKRLAGLVLLFLGSFYGYSQSSMVPLNEDYYHWVDRYEIKTGQLRPEFFTTIKPYNRQAIVEFTDSIEAAGLFSSKADRFNYEYLQNDSWEWSRAESATSRKPIFKHFYKKKSDFLYVDEPAFDLHVNPVIYFSGGSDSRLDEPLFINTRGVEIRGMIDGKVGFYSILTDNQARIPSYVNDYMVPYYALPHEGFWKNFKDGGVDFLHARGYFTFQASKHIGIQFGHDRQFLGNGYRSLVYSDFSPAALYLKMNLKIWKLNYMFNINQVTAGAVATPGGTKTSADGFPKKFIATHHLSINLGKKFNIGLFESVVFGANDSTRTNFELGYLNPIIFYRAIEQQNGSSDNVIIGMDFKWNIVKKVSMYGQLVLDEFLLENIKEGNGWWANKYGIQTGLKYIDALGVSNLDLQAEVNIMRPYTHAHNTLYGSYSSYNQSMAHPLGANFKEVVGILRYQPLPRLNLTGKLVYSQVGRDTTGVNWGSDILKDNSTHELEFGNTIGQGVVNNIMFMNFTASWMLKHNLFLDATLILRKSESEVAFYNTNTTATTLSLRWNIPQRLYEF